MILNDEQLDRIARTREGSLEEVPYAVLLFALAKARRTVVLELTRRQLAKEIVFENGTPVQCTSNLVHETLSRFMQSAGRIDEATAGECFNEACARGVRFGDVLIEKGLFSAEELRKVLQQNLARKLLDGFSWRDGTYRLGDTPDEVDSTLKVNVAQLVVFGVTRFATQEQVDGSIGPLIGTSLAIHPAPFFAPDEIRLSSSQRSVVESLGERAMRIDELATTTGLASNDLTRLLYALTLIGVVLPADQVPTIVERPAQRTPQDSTPDAPPAISKGVSAEQRDELMQLVLNYRRKDAFELLEVDEHASSGEVEARFLTFAESFAPWHYDQDLAADARHVFLAGARAFTDLADPARRQELTARRRARDQPLPKPDFADRFRITTALLDPAVQYRKGKELMREGKHRGAITQLEYAADLDPQNATYRAELAYCRFLLDPANRVPALDDLKETLRIDPRCGLAMYYSGEVLRHMGRYDEAEKAFRGAIKPMTPDRRPIEALRALAVDKKGRRKR